MVQYGRVVKSILLLLVSIILLSCGCTKENDTTSDSMPQVNLDTVPAEGEIFLAGSFKIKTVITPQRTATLDPLTFEVYVDGQGRGSGLMGYKDDVYDIIISNEKVYVKIADNVAIYISELAGHMYPSDLDVVNSTDLTSLGFTMSEGKAASFKSSTGEFLIDSTYGKSDATFDDTTVAGGNSMTITELVNYILSIDAHTYAIEEDPVEPIVPEQGSFWLNSDMGVKIHDKVYSIGDFCNPSTYFEDITPEGINPSYAYNGDKRVEFRHINYQASDGRVALVTTEGYVQTIRTTCDFEFLSIKKGMSDSELKETLGVNTNRSKNHTWNPIVEGLSAAVYKGNVYTCTYDTLTIQFKVDNKTKTLSEITISNYIDFLNE